MIEEKIINLLEEKFQEENFQDCFVVDVNLNVNNKLEVFVDADSGITFEKCRKLSRYLEEFIDEEQWLGEKYTLEVSSPGISRPLKFIRQYQKNIGRKVEVFLEDGSKKTAQFVAMEGNNIILEEKVRIKEGKKKRTEIVRTTIPFETINKTVVKISFSKK
ncbi:MAG: ribosome assembly cofactor RimP [Saprospiraceae bacterium]